MKNKKPPPNVDSVESAALNQAAKSKVWFSIGALVILVIGVIVFFVIKNIQSSTSQPLQSNSTPAVSPLLFGTNLGLYNCQDQFLTSSATRSLLQQIHVTSIRMPIRTDGTSSPSACEIQAMQDIASMGATPIIILHYNVPDLLAEDTRIVQAANNVFGNNRVIYEFGNETDLAAGATQTSYTSTWDQIIPQIKPLALNGWG